MNKYLHVTVIALILNNQVLSAETISDKDCLSKNNPKECTHKKWSLSADALFLKAGSPGLNYIGSVTSSTPNSIQELFWDRHYEYGTGFKLAASYQYVERKDVTLNWSHYNHASLQELPNHIDVFDTSFSGTVNLGLKPKWDTVNLELGQQLNPFNWGSIRLHGGLQYANLQMTSTTTGTGLIPSNGRYRMNHSAYEGVGLRIGSDLSYDLPPKFGLYTHVATAFLTGHHQFNRMTDRYRPIGGDMLIGNSGRADATLVELEGILGVAYTHILSQGAFTLNAGWMWVNYFDAIEIADSTHNGRTKESNFTLQGPFLGLKWSGFA